MPTRTELVAPANRARPQNKLARRARAANFVVDSARGMSQAAIARKYGVSPHTVKEELRWAEREGFFQKAEDAIADRLVPLAIDVYEAALREALITKDFTGAKELLKGVGLFSNGAAKSAREVSANEDDPAAKAAEELDWESFLARREQRLNETKDSGGVAPESASGTSLEAAPVVEAEVLARSDEASILPEEREGDSGSAGEPQEHDGVGA